MMPNKPTKPDKSLYHLELLIIFVVERFFFDLDINFCQNFTHVYRKWEMEIIR